MNLDKTFDLIMLALPCGVVCFDDQAAFSVLALSKTVSEIIGIENYSIASIYTNI